MNESTWRALLEQDGLIKLAITRERTGPGPPERTLVATAVVDWRKALQLRGSELRIDLRPCGPDSVLSSEAPGVLKLKLDVKPLPGDSATATELAHTFDDIAIKQKMQIFTANLGEAARGFYLYARKWWQDYTARNRGSMDNNPSPGNKKGGLTTILEKSLGAAAKGGTTPLNGVFKYAETVTAKGFTFMDTPGYDPASVTGQIAGGCNLVVFTTGRGSAFGSKPAPTIKLATNTEMFTKMVEDMDVNAGAMLTDGVSLEEKGREIYEMFLRVASGEQTKSEAQGLGDYEFVPWQIGATM